MCKDFSQMLFSSDFSSDTQNTSPQDWAGPVRPGLGS